MFPGNTKGGSITVLLTSCLTGLESAVRLLTFFVLICKTDLSKPVKQEVNCTVILPPLVFPDVSRCQIQPSLMFKGVSIDEVPTSNNTKLQSMTLTHTGQNKG